MDMAEMETLIKGAGCTYIVRTRYRQRYIYASRRFGNRMREIYIGPQSKVEQMTREAVLEKLAKLA